MLYYPCFTGREANFLPTMATIDTLGKLFGSVPRVKILRLFLLNTHLSFTAPDVARRTKTPLPVVRKEIVSFVDAGILMKAKSGWQIDGAFQFLDSLKSILVSGESFSREDILRRFKNAGRVKLFILSGIFLNDESLRADLLLVGDNLKRTIIERSIRAIEAEIGRELRYSILETEEFRYRIGVYDKFIRDVLDYPHERLIDRLDTPPMSFVEKPQEVSVAA